MTDVTTQTMIANRSIRVPGLRVPLQVFLHGLATPLALFGRTFATVLTAYGRALELAYSAPYNHPSQKRRLVSGEDLQGRDPNW